MSNNDNSQSGDFGGGDGSAAEPARLVMDSQVVFTSRVIGGETTAVAHHTALGKFFQFGPQEYRVARLLDGSRSLTEILQLLQAEGMTWEPKEVAEFLSKLVASRLAHPVTEPQAESNNVPDSTNAPKRPEDQAESESAGRAPWRDWAQRVPKLLSLMVSQRIPLIHGNGIASRLEGRFGNVFSPVGMLYWCGLVASGLLIVFANLDAFSNELKRMFDPGIWFVLILMWVFAKAIHELGHAVAARYHGVRVGRMGIMFFLFAPLAYVDVTGAWKLRSRWSRVQIALAGIYVELAVAAIAAWAWWFLPDGLLRHLAAQLVLVAGPATLLVNANPLLRLDGYYVLSDLTEIPNLRMHGRAQLASLVEWLLLRIKRPRPLLSGWRRPFATFHAACSVVFQVIWMGGLVVGISLWARGLGVVIAVAAATLWAIIPLARWYCKVWMMDPPKRWFLNRKRRRLLAYTSVVVFWGHHLITENSPLARRVPVVVQFHEEQIARASADAFVQAVYVKRGQRVEEGTLLLELDDPEFLLQRERKVADLRIAEMKAIQFRRQGELAKSAAETENADSLRRQLAELDEQLVGLQVVSERAGVVHGAGLESMLGRFVQRGEELLRISDPQEKELLASVGESDMQAYQAATGGDAQALIRLRGGAKFRAVPASLRPRARRSLPHPALAATAGGPLPVEPSPDQSDEPMRVIEPQLQSRTLLDPVTSVELHAGQIGTMTIPDNRSLMTRLLAWCDPTR